MKVISTMTGIETPTLTYSWGNTYRQRIPTEYVPRCRAGGSFTVYVGKNPVNECSFNEQLLNMDGASQWMVPLFFLPFIYSLSEFT